MDNNLNSLTLLEAVEGLKEKKFSSRDLTKSCLDRITKIDDKIKAFITVCPKTAQKAAIKADQLIKSDSQVFSKKPLLGVPYCVKDVYSTKDLKTTAASNVLRNYNALYNSNALSKTEQAGAVLLGKTNCDAWAHGASGENSDFFPTKNPWNTKKVPGGSSSGSGAAISADECIIATGTDTGGSIRCPSSFCGVSGLKPSYGRVSRYGVIAMASSLDTIGHFGKTVADIAYLLKITAGRDVNDATTSNLPVPDYLSLLNKKSSKKLKIGIPKEYFAKGIDKEITNTVQKAITMLEKDGYEFFDVSLPHTRYAVATYFIIQPAEVSSNLARFDGIRYGNHRSEFGDEAKRRIMLGTYTLSSGYYDAYYKKAMKVRTLIKTDFDQVFGKVDVLLAPVMPFLPFNLGEKINDPMQMYMADVLTAAINLSGVPSLSLPCGFSKDNLPIGMQIIGPQFKEENLFQLGDFYQNISDWHTKKPNI